MTGKSMKKTKSRKKKLLIALAAFFFFVISVLAFLQVGSMYTAKKWTHFSPDYEKADILPLLTKAERSEEEYDILYRQTGLTKLGIDDLIEQKQIERIVEIQESFFKEHEIWVNHFNPFTYQEELKNESAPIGNVKDGDIFVTGTTRVSWLRYGHAALVVDGKNRMIVESVGPGTKSEYNPIECLSVMANFMILRPKASEEIKAQVVDFAKNNLVELPYQLTVGLFTKKYKENEIKTTQCAHLVWYAYKKYGIDLDGNGGWLVKPQDIALSEQVEIVQVFGFDLDKLWS